MTDYRVPLYRPSLKGNEARYVLECLETSWISARAVRRRVESQFAAKVGARTVLRPATARLRCILPWPTGLGAGRRVIVPTLTYVASANAVAYTGAVARVCRLASRTPWQIVREAFAPPSRANQSDHGGAPLTGQPCALDPIWS